MFRAEHTASRVIELVERLTANLVAELVERLIANQVGSRASREADS